MLLFLTVYTTIKENASKLSISQRALIERHSILSQMRLGEAASGHRPGAHSAAAWKVDMSTDQY